MTVDILAAGGSLVIVLAVAWLAREHFKTRAELRAIHNVQLVHAAQLRSLDSHLKDVDELVEATRGLLDQELGLPAGMLPRSMVARDPRLPAAGGPAQSPGIARATEGDR